jgi:hypothetical protein
VAKDNARMAMIIALGQLQKHAGSDTRVTAAADIAGSSGGNVAAAGAVPANNNSINTLSKGLTAVQNGSRFWTGVWQNRDTAAQISTRTPSPYLVQWLVSGNETRFVNTPTGTHNGFLPNNATIAVNGSGVISDPKRSVVLAGKNTVGLPGPTTIGNYVSAPTVDVRTNATNLTTGRYAWWVGDEGVKAKINIPQRVTDSTQYAALSAQRRGWDSVAGFTEYPAPNTPGNLSLPRLATVAESSLLMPSVGIKTAGVSPLQAAFHSATADSFGLLVDTLNGGTKVDLHRILSGPLPTTRDPRLPTTFANYPIRGQNIIPTTFASSMRAPRWDALKEFYDRGRNLSNGTLLVRAPTDNFTAAISPIITDFRILMGLRFIASGTGFKANACGKIAIVIANPYSSPLRWTNDLEVEVRNLTPVGNSPSRIWNYKSAVFINGNPTEPAVFNNAFFRIRSDTLQPGEARAYTIAGYTLRTPGTGANRVVVDLAPFSTAAPFDFNRCIELDNNAPAFVPTSAGTTPSLDIRESWQTTQINVDMKIAGGSAGAQSLCRIERFELDNGYFSPNARSFDIQSLAGYNGPVPLMLYSFQISRPGVNYLGDRLMPAEYEMGQRASTMRTFYDFNMQGTRFFKSIASYNPAPFFMESNSSISQLPTDAPGGNTGTAFTRDLASSSLPWGRDLRSGSPRTILFSSPTQFTSLAQFQHADLTGDDLAASIGHQPGYAVGNSYANPYVKRAFTRQSRTDYELIGSPAQNSWNGAQRNYYDIAYLLNASLWDSYYLSSLPENPVLIPISATFNMNAPTDPITSASQLLIDGAFNVNSTDKNAWKAFLGSSKHFRHRADTAANPGAAYPRSLEQITTAANPPTGSDADSFSGYRRITDAELELFAVEMVRQVRLRGPFLSHSHFINRFIGDISRQPALTRSGALQQAIDESGININLLGNLRSFRNINRIDPNEDRVRLAEKNGAPRADLDGGRNSPRPADAESVPDWAVTSRDLNFGAVASIVADREMLNSLKNEQGFRSTAIPSWLTQADVLQVIGSSISPRSDTFRIRSYGEALDTAGISIAKAYCEAVVQRVPEYVDPTNNPTIRGTALTPLNRFYGRQFKIVSFRWLTAQEI